MPKNKSKNKRKPQGNINSQTDAQQGTSRKLLDDPLPSRVQGIELIKSILDCNSEPHSSAKSSDLNYDTAALYSELDSFRLRWKRELQGTKNINDDVQKPLDEQISAESLEEKENKKPVINEEAPSSSDKVYDEAKKLFLIAVGLERDELQHESIRYYKKAMHLCPDIEKRIFREQCEASARAAEEQPILKSVDKCDSKFSGSSQPAGEKLYIFERICQAYSESHGNSPYIHCKPMYKVKQGNTHISELPHELILQIFRYIVGEELDLASLEMTGLVCRGFYLLSRNPSLWRNICQLTWGEDIVRCYQTEDRTEPSQKHSGSSHNLDWRQVFLSRPRVNFDGVYISRTRYIRQGDVGFQDITYRPFHMIRYYRYLRFFPDKRVLILTTNEEPDKIIPIFRHAIDAKQFSSELSILQGTYEFNIRGNVVVIAEKDCSVPTLSNNHRRQAYMQWSRQSPLFQKFTMKFDLKTVDSKPYKNNVLKWTEYTILARMETGQEITSFDLTPDTFPNLIFSRVKKFNLRLTKPLPSPQ